MKQTRLLEIIREEIAGALREETNVTVTNSKGDNDVFPFNTPADKLEIARLKKDSNIKSIKTTSGQKIKEGEKRKSLAEKYQLDEETINEMASVVQTKKALSKLVDAGLSPKENLDLVIDVEKETLDQFRKNPRNIDGRLARVLEPDEQPNKQPNKKTGERTKGYGADFEQNFKKKSGVRFDEFTADIEEKFNKAFPDEKKFNSGLATNTTEKDAAAQIFGLEKNKPGPQADPNKPKKEKLASTGKKGKPAGEPKAEKVATRTPGEDGFDDVSYSDDEESAEAAKAAGSDETAKELGKIAYSKKLSPEEETQYETALKGIKAKIKRIEDGEEKPDDREILNKVYRNSDIKRLFKAKGLDLDNMLKGIIG